jgi:hypothetical protein
MGVMNNPLSCVMLDHNVHTDWNSCLWKMMVVVWTTMLDDFAHSSPVPALPQCFHHLMTLSQHIGFRNQPLLLRSCAVSLAFMALVYRQDPTAHLNYLSSREVTALWPKDDGPDPQGASLQTLLSRDFNDSWTVFESRPDFKLLVSYSDVRQAFLHSFLLLAAKSVLAQKHYAQVVHFFTSTAWRSWISLNLWLTFHFLYTISAKK